MRRGQRRVADPLHARGRDVCVQRFPSGRVYVRDVHVGRPRQPGLERFGAQMNRRRQLRRPCQCRRIQNERLKPRVFVDEIEVRVVVRHEPPNVRRDGGAKVRQIALGDDRRRHVEERLPLLPLGLVHGGYAIVTPSGVVRKTHVPSCRHRQARPDRRAFDASRYA